MAGWTQWRDPSVGWRGGRGGVGVAEFDRGNVFRKE